MKKDLKRIDYYFITDAGLSGKGILSDVEAAIRGGCRIVQYREKTKGTRKMIEEASKIKELCGVGVIFLVNDRVDVAFASGADGVHLGLDDMDLKTARKILGDDAIVGITVHDVKQACLAESNGADYVGVSPVYPTGTKADAGRSCGTSMVSDIRKKVKVPVVAIGGINKDNAPDVVRAGADAVCAISAVVCSGDVEKEVRDFIRIIKENKSY